MSVDANVFLFASDLLTFCIQVEYFISFLYYLVCCSYVWGLLVKYLVKILPIDMDLKCEEGSCQCSLL